MTTKNIQKVVNNMQDLADFPCIKLEANKDTKKSYKVKALWDVLYFSVTWPPLSYYSYEWSTTISNLSHHRLNMELDLQSLFGLHVHSCAHWLGPRIPPPPAFGLIYEALLVSQDRRHFFVTPCSASYSYFLLGGPMGGGEGEWFHCPVVLVEEDLWLWSGWFLGAQYHIRYLFLDLSVQQPVAVYLTMKIGKF